MIVKTFDIIPFEEWLKTKSFKTKVGDYTCSIIDEKNNAYCATIANSFSPKSKYFNMLFESHSSCKTDEDLRNWYESITEKINDRWEQFVLDTYMIDN